MINTQDLEQIVALTLYSAYIKGEKAVSVMVISDRPESGKSEIVTKFYGNKGIAFLSDVTAYALWRDFKTEIETGALKHMIIPEFLAPLSRKAETVQSFISTLQMLIEEGVMEIHTGFLQPMKLASPTAIGIIICMPREAFAQRRQEWEMSGFLSRFVVVSYKYDNNTVGTIFNSIVDRDYIGENRRIKLAFPASPCGVVIPADIGELTKNYVIQQTERIRKEGKGYGFRELKNVLRLLCANVIMKNAQGNGQRDTVNMTDFEEVKRLSYLINEEFNALREVN